MFIKKKDLPEARRRLARYHQFKTLCTELVQAHIAWTCHTGFTRRAV